MAGRAPGNELQSYVIDSLIQGVSQQAASTRRDTQCEAQFDCVNSPVNGVEARPGFEYVGVIGNVDHTNSFCYEIFRGDTEHYLVVIDAVLQPDGHRLHVYDMNTGNPCAITYSVPEDYLTATVNTPSVSLMATTLDDFTFLGNREVVTKMSTASLSPAGENAAIIYFKAGAYSTVFQVAVTYGGKVYTWTYQTPDNSTTANAPYIATNELAATFFRSFTGVDAVVTTTGTTVDSTHIGVGPAYSGSGGPTSVTGGTTLTSLGFTVALNGNIIKISRPDNNAFTVDTGDGVGDTYLHAVKDTVQNFSDLPASCFRGFTTKVIGSNQQTDDDYWVQFVGADGSTGHWEEVVAPGTSLTFDNTTMPLALVNTDVNTFVLKYPQWGSRVSGDGVHSALDPSFIGNTLEDMGYDKGRLLLMWEGGAVWSHSAQDFVFFPDSAQTALPSDPVDLKPGGGKTIALLRRIVQIAETTFLWAVKIQFRCTSGQQPWQQDTAEMPPTTSYEFSPLAIPRAIGSSLYFVTETGAYATFRDLALQNNIPVGATDVTAHVKKYIPSGIRWITASDTLGCLFCTTTGAPSHIPAYNYMLGTSSRLQSAWNKWRLPPSSVVIFAGMDLNYLYVLAQRPEGAVLLRADLTVDLTDPDTGATYLTRMDLRLNETQVVSKTYDAGSNTTTIKLPYTVPECAGWTPTSGTVCPMLVINRDSDGTRGRGHSWTITGFPQTPATQITVQGDCTGDHFYVGFRIRAEMTLSRFYLKTNKGLVPTENLQVKSADVNYGQGTGYFRAEVTYTDGPPDTQQEFNTVTIGDLSATLGEVPLREGSFRANVDADNDKYALTLVNDSFLPSRWVSLSYNFKASFRSAPGPYGQSIPNYFAHDAGSSGASNNF